MKELTKLIEVTGVATDLLSQASMSSVFAKGIFENQADNWTLLTETHSGGGVHDGYNHITNGNMSMASYH